MAKNIIIHEENGIQPWVVYTKKGKQEIFRCGFSTKEGAEEWIAKHGDRVF